MSASDYDGRFHEPPYPTEEDQRDALLEEMAKLLQAAKENMEWSGTWSSQRIIAAITPVLTKYEAQKNK